MFRRSNHETETRRATATNRQPAQFAITLLADGRLLVQATGSTVRYEDLDSLLKLLLAQRRDPGAQEVILDFSAVDHIEAPWTPAIACLIRFARCPWIRCSLTGLHGQPAAIVSFLGGSEMVRSLLGISGRESAFEDRVPA